MLSWNSKALSYVKYVIIFIVVFSFIFFGIYETIASNQPYIAKIDGRKITIQEYNGYLSKRRTEILSGSMGDKVIYNQAVTFVESDQFSKLALNEMINRVVIHKFLLENGIKVTPKAVADYIKTMPSFQKDGKFNMEYLSQYLKYIGLSEYDFLQNQVPQVEQMLFEQILSPMKIQSHTFANEYSMALKKERNIDVLYIKSASEPKFSEEELRNIYEKNRENFVEMAQHFVVVSYIDDYINSNLNIFGANSNDIMNYYNDEFTGKVMDFFYAQFSDKKTAETAQSIVKKQGISLQTVVNEMKKQRDSVIKSGDTSSEKMENKAILKGISKLSEGNVTGVIKDGKSYFVVQISKIHETKFSQVLASQTEDVVQQRKCHNANVYIERIKQELESGSSFESVSLKYGFPVSKELRVDTATGNVFDANTNLPSSINEKLKNSVVNNSDAKYGHVIVLDDVKCSYAIYQQNRIEPQRIKTLDEVRGQIISMQLEAKKLEELEKAAKNIIGQVQSLKTQLGAYSSRGSFESQIVTLQTAFSPEIFNHKVGDIFYITEKDAANESVAVIVKINSDTPFYGETNKEDLANAREFTTRAYYNAFAKAFIDKLYKEYKVEKRA